MTRCDFCDTLHDLPHGAKCPECPKGLCWQAVSNLEADR